MSYSKRKLGLVGVLVGLATSFAYANADMASGQDGDQPKRPARIPHTRQALPPSALQLKYDLPESTKPRLDLLPPQQAAQTAQRMTVSNAATAECSNMTTLSSHTGADLADYLASMPSVDCTYPLYYGLGTDATLKSAIYSHDNLVAVADRFVAEADKYDASNIVMNTLLNYFRAGYIYSDGDLPKFSDDIRDTLRPAIKRFLLGKTAFKVNPSTPDTPAETLKLLTNMPDEAYFLPTMRELVGRFTNSTSKPHAAYALHDKSVGLAFTALLKVFYYGQSDQQATRDIEQNDASYSQALFKFVRDNKKDLLGTKDAFQLDDATDEAFRFLQYPQLLPALKPMLKAQLATTSLHDASMPLWYNAASWADWYDHEHCADYGVCNYGQALGAVILKQHYTCSPTIRINAQEMSQEHLIASCDLLSKEEAYFHQMMKTNNTPVPNDFNDSLEVNIFHNYTEYDKYAGYIFGIGTNNGGMYLEGNPAVPGNQARFICHEASWLPYFSVWNLKHEYVHYLDGRFDTWGDFGDVTSVPSVWYLEGLAEYISRENDDPESIQTVNTANPNYPLSEVFNTTYQSDNYSDRAYRWGYMGVRFMFEKHRADIDSFLAKFRAGDYVGYWSQIQTIGTQYDAEFVAWAAQATTGGCTPLPGQENTPCTVPVVVPPVVTPPVVVPPVVLPPAPCNTSNQLNSTCWIDLNLSSGNSLYAAILLPSGASNLKVWTTGGTGDVDLYVNFNTWAKLDGTDTGSSATVGSNEESVAIPTPVTGNWYYVTVKANANSAGATLRASYD